ncbi:hypothetical protein PR202_ga26865 [Eleusine coracana subsp. coracana]|uniref:N-acetyltransferase domain-containing protein n=1 Tax=Eleusine coracana subsp. coracana TaxID=191504 RepID=A0AAV5DG54_ELECO|nr:hypothetical protein PR202_ga26865 [Eleusine coracana subsp. coracana]
MATGAVTPPQPPLAAARRGLRGRGVLHRRLAASPICWGRFVVLTADFDSDGGKDTLSDEGRKESGPLLSPRKDESVVSKHGGKEDMVADSLNVARGASHPGLSSSICNQPSVFRTPLLPAEPSDLRFNRLRPSIDESDCKYKRLFGCYAAREAIIDEEYWIAAWLRAEDHYEDQSGDRYVESFKRKYASQVKNDDLRRTVLNSVVGTLDVCVRHPLHGEKFPAEPGKSSLHCRIYQPDQPKFGYLTNVCVAKFARRQGIASNMLLLAIDAAKLNGAQNIYIHVHKDNLPAWRLYDQIGFKMVNQDGAGHSSDLCLLSFSL